MKNQENSESTTTTSNVVALTKPSASSAAVDSKQNRIPSALQVVFLSSNRGTEVMAVPPGRVADKTYVRNWRFQQQGGSKNGSKRRSSFSSGENEEAPLPIIRRDSMPKLAGSRKAKSGTPEDEVRVALNVVTGTIDSRCTFIVGAQFLFPNLLPIMT
jgi:hypothetical protein